MGFTDQDIALVRQSTDIIAIISEHISLKKSGRRWVGVCPFHSEKTPSFSVNAEEGLYYCFGCHASGDVITFVRDIEQLDFVEAIHYLAERANINIEETTNQGQAKNQEKRSKVLEALDQASTFYHEQLLSHPDAELARQYLSQRNISENVIQQFRIGWSPPQWGLLESQLALDRKTLVAAGLGFINRRGRFQDSMQERITFPIFDPSSKVIAFGGRIVPGTGKPGDPPQPKYKNSPETIVYSKRRTLYGLNWAKKDVTHQNEIIVCEGYTDVIGFSIAGINRAVATCGTALGEDHFVILQRFAKKIVLAFDADSAGSAGTERVYQWEKKHNVDIYVVDLPSGQDPGSLSQANPALLADLLATASPFLGFMVNRLLSSSNLSTIEGRSKALETIVGVIAQHPNNLVQDQYLVKVAERTDVPIQRARQVLAQQVRQYRYAQNRAARDDTVRLAATKPTTTNPAKQLQPPNTPGGTAAIPSHETNRTDTQGGTTRISSHETNRTDTQGGTAAIPSHETNRTLPPQPPTPPTSDLEDEALRLVMAGEELIQLGLPEILFSSVAHRKCFIALQNSAFSLSQALSILEPLEAKLLSKLAAGQPTSLPEEVWRALIEKASLRSISAIERTIHIQPDKFAELEPLKIAIRVAIEELRDLKNPASSTEAANSLLGWLIEHESGEMFVN